MIFFSLFISGAELAFTLFIVLLVFGAENIPEIARGLAKTIRVIRDASGSIKAEIEKTAQNRGIDKNFAGQVQNEIKKIKEELGGIAGNVKRNL